MEKKEKLGFLKKLKIAIFNLEKYGQLITENLNHSIKYIAILVLICSICFSIIDTNKAMKMINKSMNYITNQMPNFEVKDGEIYLENEVYGYDEEFDIEIISIDKNNLTDSELEKFGKERKTIILLKDKIVLNTYGTYSEYSYNYIKQSLNIEQVNKQKVIDLYNEVGGNTGISIIICISLILIYFIANSYEMLIYVLIVATFGYLVAQIGKIRIRFSTSVTLAIYSLTLSIILNLVYIIQYNFTGFEIPYFDILYLGIAYIYIVAAILIIKSDLIKQVIELQKIQQEQQKEFEENENKDVEKNKEKEDTSNDKKENEEDSEETLDKEPDGSEI